jgi:hypothetical protein
LKSHNRWLKEEIIGRWLFSHFLFALIAFCLVACQAQPQLQPQDSVPQKSVPCQSSLSEPAKGPRSCCDRQVEGDDRPVIFCPIFCPLKPENMTHDDEVCDSGEL